MFMAMLMKSKMNITDEEIITQGDEASLMFILMTGKAKVFLNQSNTEDNLSKMVAILNAKKKFMSLKQNQS